MIRAILQLFTLALFVSCTAINQQDAFLDSLPRPSNVVFNDERTTKKLQLTAPVSVVAAGESGAATQRTIVDCANGSELIVAVML